MTVPAPPFLADVPKYTFFYFEGIPQPFLGKCHPEPKLHDVEVIFNKEFGNFLNPKYKLKLFGLENLPPPPPFCDKAANSSVYFYNAL